MTSEYQLDELRKVLARERLRPYIKPEEAQDLIDNLEAVGTLVSELPECELSPDPADNPILATAIAGKANLIVSGDKTDMLALGRVDDIRIVSPSSALGMMGHPSEEWNDGTPIGEDLTFSGPNGQVRMGVPQMPRVPHLGDMQNRIIR